MTGWCWQIGWCIPTGCLRYLGQLVFQSGMPLASLYATFHAAVASNPPFGFDLSTTPNPSRPSLSRAWLDNTHHPLAELKGKAVVLADLAELGRLPPNIWPGVSACIPRPEVRCFSTALSSMLRCYTSITRRPTRTPCLPREAERFCALIPAVCRPP